MAGEWQVDSLGALIDVKHGFAFEGEFIHDEPRGNLLLTPGNFRIGGGFKGDRFKYYDGPVLEEFVLREGDLLVTMTDLSKKTDTLGYPAFVPAPGADCRYLHNQRLGKVIIKDPNAADARYLHYLMCSADYRHEVLASATGTTVKHTSPERIRRFSFRRPPLPEQRAIAHVLGTLDDKIELNRRMNETLETMARALFKSWFVDFDPVRAKAEGRDPGLPQPLADLFPDRFEDSELGEIPKGWRTSRLGDILELKRGYDLPSVQRRPGGVTIVSSSGPSGTHDEAKVQAPGIVTGRYGTIGEVFFVREDFWPLNTALYVRDFKGTNALYAYYLLQSVDFEKFSDKAAVPGINRNHLHEERLVVPPPGIQGHFGKLAGTWLDRKANSERQSETLAEIRDTLLPKLISGELRVKDAERFLKERELT